MAIFDIITYPDERIRTPCDPVERFDTELEQFMHSLEETMRAGPGGVGIAAPQVGHFIRAVIVDVSSKPKIANHGRIVLINPEIQHWEGMSKGREGCMSVPDYTGDVMRAKSIKVKGYDLKGNTIEYESSGFEARAIQHEIDHLDGLLFLDRLISRHNDLYKRKNYQQPRQQPTE